jgi:hypothetical protein
LKTFFSRLKDFAADLSLANLCFLKVWVFALYQEDKVGYYFNGSPFPFYLATFSNILILAILLYSLRELDAKHTNTFISNLRLVVIIIATGLALNGFRIALVSSNLFPSVSKQATILGAIALFTTTVLLILKYRIDVPRYITRITLVFIPLLLVILNQTAVYSAKWEPPPTRDTSKVLVSTPPPPNVSTKSPHIVWIIFDEMDQRISFTERPASLKLPEFDRFRIQALSADNALPPAGATSLSIPALMSGHLFSKATPSSANDLFLKYAGLENQVQWSSLPSVFSRLNHLGFTSQAAGFYQPYNRIFAQDLINGYSYPISICADTRTNSIFDTMLNSFVSLFQARIFSPQSVSHHTSIFRQMHQQAISDITNPITLTFLHYPIPHKPYIYDRNTRKFSGNFLPQTHNHYLDNLALADRTFGEIRKKLESAGIWESSTIIVSADHWWRFSKEYDNKIDYRVPFMVKLSGQKTPSAYHKPFNTVLTSDMILEVVKGSISSQEELSIWLDKNGKNIQPEHKITQN